jgi:hypothetical protein
MMAWRAPHARPVGHDRGTYALLHEYASRTCVSASVWGTGDVICITFAWH